MSLQRRRDPAQKPSEAGDGEPYANDPDDTDDAGKPDEPGEKQAISERIEALLDRLATQGYLSDERFVESRVRVRAARFGSQRIAHELKQHGLAMTPDAARNLASGDLARAIDIWRRRFGRAGADRPDAKAWARQIRFLVARGFSTAVAQRAQKLGAADGDNTDANAPD